MAASKTKTTPKVLLTKVRALLVAMDKWSDAEEPDDAEAALDEMWRARGEFESVLEILDGPRAASLFNQ